MREMNRRGKSRRILTSAACKLLGFDVKVLNYKLAPGDQVGTVFAKEHSHGGRNLQRTSYLAAQDPGRIAAPNLVFAAACARPTRPAFFSTGFLLHVRSAV